MTTPNPSASKRLRQRLAQRAASLVDAVRDALFPVCEYEPIPIPARRRPQPGAPRRPHG